MLKVISLLKRKADMSFEDFRKWALEEHPPLGKKLPGIRHYRMSVVLVDNPELPYDAVSEFWFDDEAARVAAFATEAGKAAGADAAAHCSSRVHLLTEERILID
ncbi:MAG TPA: EthD family reductase [Chloroflexi bacterium]|nr:EthD family reductase [Chloroflexota bacterium]